MIIEREIKVFTMILFIRIYHKSSSNQKLAQRNRDIKRPLKKFQISTLKLNLKVNR